MQLSLWRVKNQAISPGLSHVGIASKTDPATLILELSKTALPSSPKDTHLRQC